MISMRTDAMASMADCEYQASLEWEKMLASRNLRYFVKAYSRRLCDTEDYSSETMRSASIEWMEHRYGQKIRMWRSRELFADEELAKLAAKREAAKVMQMATQVTSWAEAHRGQNPAAQQEQLPFFEPGRPSGSYGSYGSYTSQFATTNQAAQQVANWIPDAVKIIEVDEKVEQPEAHRETEKPGVSESSAASAVGEAPEAEKSSPDWVVPKGLAEAASAFASESPVPPSDIEAALAKFMELATATSAVPLSSWSAQLLGTQPKQNEPAPWNAVKRPLVHERRSGELVVDAPPTEPGRDGQQADRERAEQHLGGELAERATPNRESVGSAE